MSLKTRTDRSYLYSKRAIDLAGASLLLVLLLPLMIITALAIRLDSHGPALFNQRRYGRHHSIFTLHKFRTMRHEDGDPFGAVQEAPEDARITRVGHLLRRTSIDELPQLWNVLKGDMSLVGPRPHPIGMRTQGRLCCEVSSRYHERYSAKPGLTGWAQVNGARGPTRTVQDVVARTEYDIDYLHRRSLAFDLRILVLTVPHLLDPRRQPARPAVGQGPQGPQLRVANSPPVERPSLLRARQAEPRERGGEANRPHAESRTERLETRGNGSGVAPYRCAEAAVRPPDSRVAAPDRRHLDETPRSGA